MDSLLDSDFSLQRTVLLAGFSNLSYSASGDILQEWAEQNGFDEAKGQTVGQYRFCWASGRFSGKRVLVLAFRGSENARNWITNFRLLPVNHPAGMGTVHRGFLNALNKVKPLVTAQWALLDPRPDFIWITGHSLGGAMALLADLWIRGEGVSSTGLHTFGQPRVGLSTFADRVQQEIGSRYFRCVNQHDIVTRVPPGFSHCGTLKHIVRPGVLELSGGGSATSTSPILDEEEPPALTKKQFEAFQSELAKAEELPGSEGERIHIEGNIPWVRQHSMDEYVRLLREL